MENIYVDYYNSSSNLTTSESSTYDNFSKITVIAAVIISAITISKPIIDSKLLSANNVIIEPANPELESKMYISSGSFIFGGVNMKKQKFNRSISTVNEIAELKDNWDGYGASAFSKKLVEQAKNLILSLPSEPKVFPTGNDSIQFEYEKQNGDYLEFELFENRIKRFHLYPDNTHVTDFISSDTMREEVAKFEGTTV